MGNTRFVAAPVTFDYSVLLVGEVFMDELLKRVVAASQALKAAGIPHAVIGGLAVRAYVATVDPSAMMSTRDIDILLRRQDLGRAEQALAPLGYVYRELLGLPAFVPPGGKFRDGIHVVLAGEKVRADSPHPCPELLEGNLVDVQERYTCLDVKNLVIMKLTSFRPKDEAHLQDLLELGLIPPGLAAELPDDLRKRLDQVVAQNRREGRL